MFRSNGTNMLVADSPEDFADSVARLYRDEELWERLREGGSRTLEEHFSVNRAALGVSEMLSHLRAPMREDGAEAWVDDCAG